MATHLFFYLAVSFILIHEMDAVRCREWRIFPGLNLLSDRTGMIWFMLLHIPLFALLIQSIGTGSESVIFGLNIFFMAHVGAHLLLYRHPKNEFTDWISWTMILGAGVCGGLDLLFPFK